MPRRSWWARLPFGVRMTAGASAILVVTGGGAVVVAAFIDQEPGTVVTTAGQETPGVVAVAPVLPSAEARLGEQTEGRPDRTATPKPRRTRTLGAVPAPEAGGAVPVAVRPVRPAPAAGPVVTIRTVSEKRKISFQTRRVRDWHLARGDERVESPGLDGEETLRFRVTYIDGRQTDRRLLKSEVTREPQQRIVAFGTRRGDDRDGDDRDGDDDDNRGDGDRDDEDWDDEDSDDCWPGVDGCLPVARVAVCPRDAAEATEHDSWAGGDENDGEGWREDESWREDEHWDR